MLFVMSEGFLFLSIITLATIYSSYVYSDTHLRNLYKTTPRQTMMKISINKATTSEITIAACEDPVTSGQ